MFQKNLFSNENPETFFLNIEYNNLTKVKDHQVKIF